MQKLFAGLTGLLLLPCAAGLATTLYQALILLQMEDAPSRTLSFFLAGAGLWVILFIGVSRPVRSYILAHELSHLLAAWLSGVRGGGLRVGRDGGSVEVEKSSLWIALAPYLIPFYSLLLLAAHWLASLWWDPAIWSAWLPFGLGLTWSFHLCFTLYILAIPQSDIQPYGRLGAFSIILCGNLLILCLALFVIDDQSAAKDLQLFLQEQATAYRIARHGLQVLFSSIKNTIIQS